MILIADSGSTKTSWCFIDGRAEKHYFETEGYNPYFADTAFISRSLQARLPAYIDPTLIREVHFYGAGCFEDKAAIVYNALRTLFPGAGIAVELDLLASARAVLGDRPGFAAILGTGTNSCLYDGRKIVSNIDSLGYILGDEGSGSYIGKKLIADYIRGYMPSGVEQEFFAMYGLSREEIMEAVYTRPMANRFCAGFTRFIQESRGDVLYTRGLVKHAFINFFESLVVHYSKYEDYSFNCVGSIGYIYREILKEVAGSYGMETGTIIKDPITGLAGYHASGFKINST